ncbi:hypothetical protein JTE90_006434 [Oedothorax gibbosus]|uniref:Uncharacterized protein n=1 Tax=Oedothorax gibbosus TaxID=931172 RepID=A0AAV6TIV4_9ARAC|nr:hypothetical protein JTE90_006434 [Oedothorax gibbosus]
MLPTVKVERHEKELQCTSSAKELAPHAAQVLSNSRRTMVTHLEAQHAAQVLSNNNPGCYEVNKDNSRRTWSMQGIPRRL